MEFYRIKDWAAYYEVAQARSVKRWSWVALPIKHDGKGYRRVVARTDGAAMLGAWMLIVQVAAKCPIRGVLADTDGPLTAEDLAIKTGVPALVFQEALPLFCSEKIGWLLLADAPDARSALTANIPDAMSALELHNITLHNQTRQNSSRGKKFSADDVPAPKEWPDTPELRSAVTDWLDHKRSRGEPYKSPASMTRLLKRFAKDFPADGPAQFIAAVDFSIGMNYQGCFPDRGAKHGKSKSPAAATTYDPNAPTGGFG